MSQSRVNDTGESVRNALVSPIKSVLLAVQRSFIVFVAAVGVVFLVLSVLLSEYVLPGVTNGVISGMGLIWGVSAFVYAALGYVGLRLIGHN